MLRFDLFIKTAALLSRMYLVLLISLVSWVVLPVLIGWTPTIVSSGSMLPNVHIGDVVVAQNIAPELKETMIGVGHVLLATDPLHEDKLVTHRVVNIIKGNGYITKGDANAVADPDMIPLANVHGIERLRIPLIGKPIQEMRAGNLVPLIFFSVVTIAAQIIVRKDKKGTLLTVTATPVHRKGKHRTATSRTKIITRIAYMVVNAAVVMILSLSVASSAALFSGTTTNSSNDFRASSDFGVTYKNGIISEAPFAYYRFNETSGRTIADSSGNNREAQTSKSGVTFSATGPLTRDTSDKAVTLDGSKGSVTGSDSMNGPQSMTAQLWFKTTSNSGGKLIGFSKGKDNSDIVDRVLYMTNAGKIVFGMDMSTMKTIQTPLSYNDGKWHMAVATMSGLNAALYIDGKLITTGITTSEPTSSSGYWLIGGDNFPGWANQPTSSYFNGSIDEVAIYTKALTAIQIATQYAAY